MNSLKQGINLHLPDQPIFAASGGPLFLFSLYHFPSHIPEQLWQCSLQQELRLTCGSHLSTFEEHHFQPIAYSLILINGEFFQCLGKFAAIQASDSIK